MNRVAADQVRIASLHCYPLKSAAGLTVPRATLGGSGFLHDRGWMLVDEAGVFLTQREVPLLALIRTELNRGERQAAQLTLHKTGMPAVTLPVDDASRPCRVRVFRDECAAFDAGDEAARWVTAALQRPCRVVRFDPAQSRNSASEWTGGIAAPNLFSDGFPILVAARESLQELNSRLQQALPMNRFRPNLVIEGLDAWAEDRIHELVTDDMTLRLVKPCTRCSITTTDQERGTRDGDEPLRTLRGYRYDAALHGVLFGQNAIIIRGVGATLAVGQPLSVRWKS